MVACTHGAIAACVVDLRDGRMITGFFIPGVQQDDDQPIVSAVTSLYQGLETMGVETLLGDQRKDSSKAHHLQEAHVSTNTLLHFAAKLENLEAAVCLTTRKSGDIASGSRSIRNLGRFFTYPVPSYSIRRRRRLVSLPRAVSRVRVRLATRRTATV